MFHVCSKLNSALLDCLIGEYTDVLSLNSVRQLMLDVHKLEDFAKINNEESAEAFIQVLLTFLPVRSFYSVFPKVKQLLDLLIRNDWNAYIASYDSPSRLYLRVKPSDARAVFEKLNWDNDGSSHGSDYPLLLVVIFYK